MNILGTTVPFVNTEMKLGNFQLTTIFCSIGSCQLIIVHKSYTSCLPHQVKMQYLHFNFMQTTFFYLGRFLKKFADDQCSSIPKDSIYHIKHNIHTTFYHSGGLTRKIDVEGKYLLYVLYLQILRLYLGRHMFINDPDMMSLHNKESAIFFCLLCRILV